MFVSENTINVPAADLVTTANAVMHYFRAKSYTVSGQQTGNAGWHISLTKGATLAAIVGLRSTLRIDISPRDGGIHVRAAAVGITLQLIPLICATAFVLLPVTTCLAIPFLALAIVGIVRQANLDDEGLKVVEQSLLQTASPAHGAISTGNLRPNECTRCGNRMGEGARFCVECGLAIP